MDYNVIRDEDVPVIDLGNDPLEDTGLEYEKDIMPSEIKALDVQLVDDALELENMAVKIWHFEPGDEVSYHQHEEQEELYYILKGQFSIKLGKSGETEIIERGEGAFFAASKGVGHGYRYVGDEHGVVLAIGAPSEFDPGQDPHSA